MGEPVIRPALLIATLLLAGSALAGVERDAVPAAPSEDAPRTAADCPRLFGTPAMHQANAQRREKRLYWTEANDRLEIAHATQWKEPMPVTFPGVAVLEVSPTRARLRLDDRFSDLGCAPGEYVVRRDQALGKGNRVVALFRDVMVVEMGRKLTWAGTPGTQPGWRMIWGSPYYFRRPSTGAVTVSKGQRARATRRPRPTPNRRPRRR
ncbi:MAG: hypothetical protein KC549_07700 [Myxococcales bacterium]|nr:hypothetical protein [Myxococcales bacterium]MCB9548527.1 hypothetical protein [Myxococcales bacterium]